MKKILFLFGAGVEGAGNFDLPTGYEYLRNSLFGNEYREDITKALKKFFSKKYYSGSYMYEAKSYSNANALLKNLLKSKILEDDSFLLKYQRDISIILSDEDFRELSGNSPVNQLIEGNNIEHINNEQPRRQTIENEFKKALTTSLDYIALEEPILKDLFIADNKGKTSIDMNIGIGGLLDGYFHTIISPTKYGKAAFSKVFNYYWMCYFAIVDKVANYLKDKVPELDSYFTDDKLDYYKILSEIQNFTQLLYSLPASSISTGLDYYLRIKEAFAKEIDYEIIDIATTNYYRFCENIKNNAIYLNGNLACFEFPELLEVRNVLVEGVSNDNLFFPFIFGQSHVKPIVHQIQTDAYSRLAEVLADSDILVVLGFNINEDDNHINAFIHQYAKTGKRLIIVGQMSTDKGKEESIRKLKCSEDAMEYCSVTYGNNNDVVNAILNTIKAGTKP